MALERATGNTEDGIYRMTPSVSKRDSWFGVSKVRMDGWWGRVFGLGTSGGNHTVIAWPADGVGDLSLFARRLDVPDTGFVVGRGRREIRLRTLSPVEELTQCWQASLAAKPWTFTERGTSFGLARRRPVCGFSPHPWRVVKTAPRVEPI
jgi:hypothetical protein